eukprot:SAG11_NODE_1157_length_5657_cov_30.018712_4_plen_214_part_00
MRTARPSTRGAQVDLTDYSSFWVVGEEFHPHPPRQVECFVRKSDALLHHALVEGDFGEAFCRRRIEAEDYYDDVAAAAAEAAAEAAAVAMWPRVVLLLRGLTSVTARRRLHPRDGLARPAMKAIAGKAHAMPYVVSIERVAVVRCIEILAPGETPPPRWRSSTVICGVDDELEKPGAAREVVTLRAAAGVRRTITPKITAAGKPRTQHDGGAC